MEEIYQHILSRIDSISPEVWIYCTGLILSGFAVFVGGLLINYTRQVGHKRRYPRGEKMWTAEFILGWVANEFVLEGETSQRIKEFCTNMGTSFKRREVAEKILSSIR